MRRVEHTTAFRRDFKRERRGRYGAQLETVLPELVRLLVEDRELPARFRDHGLVGQWSDFRDCHWAPDPVLIYYRKVAVEALQFVRLGSHAELFGR